MKAEKKELVIWTASSMTENWIKFDRFAVSFPCDSFWCTASFRTISKTCNAVILRTHHRDNESPKRVMKIAIIRRLQATLCISYFHFVWSNIQSTDYVNYSSIFCIWQTKAFYQSSLQTSTKTICPCFSCSDAILCIQILK